MKVSKKALRAALAAKGVGEEAIEAIIACLLEPTPDQTFDFGSGPVPAHQHTNPDGTVGGWVADTATVAPTAFIGPNARVYGFALVFGTALIHGNARVSGNTWVFGNARVYDAAQVSEGEHE